MLDDFSPRRPTPPPVNRGRKPEQLTGFRPSSTLPQNAGDDLVSRQPQVSPIPPRNSAGPQQPTPPIAPPAPHSSELPPMTSKKKSKKKWLFILLALLIISAGAAAFWYFGLRDSGQPVSSTNTTEVEVIEEEPEVTTVPASLSGLDVTAAEAERSVTAVMIENSGEARPQSGLLEADMVYEAVAEGGITRFLALYQVGQPQYLGPIRSARPYYAEWAKTFDATYIHAGGSPDGLQRIKELDVKDMSAFSDTEVFYRTTDRFAPHNLYSSFKGIDALNKQNGFTESKFEPWDRKIDVPQTIMAQNINLAISSDFYNVNYAYNAPTNTYLRSEGGEPHIDERTNKQLNPKVVVAMAMNKSQNGIYSVYQTTGSGKVLVFQDGVVTEGTWSRSGATDQYKFTDKYGFPIVFNKGQTWVSVVSNISDVTYQP